MSGKTYREINIFVGLGLSTTRFLGEQIDVVSENSIAKLILTFPSDYISYTKVIVIQYVSADAVLTTESYVLNTDPITQKHYFVIERKFTYGEECSVQFEARYSDGQVAIDPRILVFRFKRSLYSTNLQPIDADPDPSYTVILQNMVNEHAVTYATNITLGHVSVDNDTITINNQGVISATRDSELSYILRKNVPDVYFRRTDFRSSGNCEIIPNVMYFIPYYSPIAHSINSIILEAKNEDAEASITVAIYSDSSIMTPFNLINSVVKTGSHLTPYVFDVPVTLEADSLYWIAIWSDSDVYTWATEQSARQFLSNTIEDNGAYTHYTYSSTYGTTPPSTITSSALTRESGYNPALMYNTSSL